MDADDRRANPLPRCTRLPGPTPRQVEEDVAEIVEGACRLYDLRELGPRTRQDHNGVGELRVDFTYETARPPVALEVTELASFGTRATSSELEKLEERLAKIVERDKLGQWTLGIKDGSDVRALEPPLVELLQRTSARSGVKLINSDAQLGVPDNELSEILSASLTLGLAHALHLPDDEDRHGVMIFPPLVDAALEAGFSDLLEEAIASNAAKLEEARPRETHLAVFAARTVSSNPALTPPPDLPESIDALWVLLGYYNAKATYRTWRTTRGDRQWSLLHHPLGRPSGESPVDPDETRPLLADAAPAGPSVCDGRTTSGP